jgi:hypothetical protein
MASLSAGRKIHPAAIGRGELHKLHETELMVGLRKNCVNCNVPNITIHDGRRKLKERWHITYKSVAGGGAMAVDLWR